MSTIRQNNCIPLLVTTKYFLCINSCQSTEYFCDMKVWRSLKALLRGNKSRKVIEITFPIFETTVHRLISKFYYLCPFHGVDYFGATSSPAFYTVLGIIDTKFYGFKGPRLYTASAEGRSRRRIQGSNPLTTPRLYRRTPSSRTPGSCLERENDSRPRSNSVDRVLGHQGDAGRNFKTRPTGRLRETEAHICPNKIRV